MPEQPGFSGRLFLQMTQRFDVSNVIDRPQPARVADQGAALDAQATRLPICRPLRGQMQLTRIRSRPSCSAAEQSATTVDTPATSDEIESMEENPRREQKTQSYRFE